MVRCSETKDDSDSVNWTIALVDFLSLSVRPPRSSRRRLKLHVRTKSGKPRCSFIAFLFIGWCLSIATLFLASSSLRMTEDVMDYCPHKTLVEKRNAHVFKSLVCGFNILQFFLCNMDCSVRLLFSLFPPFSFSVHKWFSAFVLLFISWSFFCRCCLFFSTGHMITLVLWAFQFTLSTALLK